VEFQLLGPVCVSVGGKQLGLGGPKPRTLLAVLAVSLGRIVPVEVLISALWGEDAPTSARAMVQTYVSTLRRVLAGHGRSGSGVLLVRQAPGYLLEADPDMVDLCRFESLAAEGRRAYDAGDYEVAAAALTKALGLWRGMPMGGIDGDWAERERARLVDDRLTGVELCADAELRLRRGVTALGDLTALVAEHPLREGLRARWMLALHAAGRKAEALEAFHDGRKVLDEELGVEPGPELQAALRVVLDRAEVEEEVPTPVDPPTPVGPSQLPAAISDFVGRHDDEVRVLDQLTTDTSADAVRILVVSGKPGSGKTTLAVRAAHRLRQHYPDGQLFASLNGNQLTPVDPGDVLARFLRALGITDTRIPADLGERGDLYRTLLAERRVLVVLDDAANEQQLRPLIPAGAGCAVLITSRRRMAAIEGATQFDLGELPTDESLRLLEKLVPGPRLAAEPDATLELIRLCGRLPLAVRIAGARLGAHPHWTVAGLVGRLSRQHHVLNELVIGDLEVRGSLALSYGGLDRNERAALRRLTVTGVREFAAWVAAPLLDVPVADAEVLVDRLADAQLLDVAGADATGVVRYRFHDLTWAFAVETCAAEEPADEVDAALGRVCETVLALVRRSTSRVPNSLVRPVLDREDVGGLPTDLVDRMTARPVVWFECEQALLVSLVEGAGERDLVGVATRLASTLSSSSFAVRNEFSQWHRTHMAALNAAQRCGDRAGEALLLAGMGELYYELDRFDESMAYYQQALTAYRDVADDAGRARTQLSLSFVLRERGWYPMAEEALSEAIPVLRVVGTDDERAQAAHNLGMIRTEQGDLAGAAEAVDEAMEIWRRAGNRRGAALALRSAGIVHRAADRLDEAAACCGRAADELHAIGDRLVIAYADQAVAKVLIRQGRPADARSMLNRALATCHEMQDGFGQALMQRTLGELELAVGNPAAAAEHLGHSLDWWRALDLPVWQARTTRDLAAVEEMRGSGRGPGLRAWAQSVFEKHGCREEVETPRPVGRRDTPRVS
jgi:DNA-binding SARP family transcriptional activator/tetratricopeptide (TPR) repeat protein